MPIYKIMDEMPYEELQGWIKYLNLDLMAGEKINVLLYYYKHKV